MENDRITWLGTIPDAWKLTTISSFYDLRNEKVSDKDYPPLSVTMKGIVPQLESAAKTDNGDNRKLVKKGDFAINSRSDRRGSCGISKYDGSVSLINTVLQPKGEMNPDYYDWLFHTVAFADEFYKWGHGIVDDLWTTRWQEMKQILIPVPPLNVQSAIAAYLDDQISRIDSIIAEAKTSIEEYKQWKASIIFEAVTKGLDPDVEMRNSGTEFGSVPNNWQVIRLKNIACEIFKGNGITKEDIVEDGDTFCVRYGEIYSKYNFFFEHCLTKTNKNRVVVQRYFSYGDILFAGTGELVEEIGKGIVYIGNDVCLAGGDIIVVKHTQNPVFMAYALNSNYIQIQKSRNKAKLKVVHISSADIGSLIVFLPPIEEQNIIADYLKEKCSMIDSIIKEKESLIGDLEQYKRSLIYEVVTGKRKVV